MFEYLHGQMRISHLTNIYISIYIHICALDIEVTVVVVVATIEDQPQRKIKNITF